MPVEEEEKREREKKKEKKKMIQHTYMRKYISNTETHQFHSNQNKKMR